MNERSVQIERKADGTFVARNERGGEMHIGLGTDDATFSPIELLLVALGACTAMDVAAITTKRSEPESFGVTVSADKIRDSAGNRLADIDVDLRVRFPADEGGDKARAVLDRALQQSHDRLCTVSRTLQTATPLRSRAVTISD